jgi:hypothetical protein
VVRAVENAGATLDQPVRLRRHDGRRPNRSRGVVRRLRRGVDEGLDAHEHQLDGVQEGVDAIDKGTDAGDEIRRAGDEVGSLGRRRGAVLDSGRDGRRQLQHSAGVRDG